MTTKQYQKQFNKQLAEQLDSVRRQQPNHIPVYSMKYKNASKYLVQDLKQPLALFPKKFKLKTVYEIIQKQSVQYCKQTLIKTDSKVMKEGDNFKLPSFHLYTIQIIKKNQQSPTSQKQLQQSPNPSNNKKPIGRFVKLDLQLTFQQAFEKYGRENVLTIVYTDVQQVRYQYTRTQRTVQKWTKRVFIFILILIIIPYLMKDQSQDKGFNNNNISATVNSTIEKATITTPPLLGSNKNTNNQQLIIDHHYNKLDIDTIQQQPFQTNLNNNINQRTINYDDETI